MDIQRRQPIGVELVRRGIIKEADIEKALQYQKDNPQKKLGDIIYELNLAEPSTLIETIGDIIGITE